MEQSKCILLVESDPLEVNISKYERFENSKLCKCSVNIGQCTSDLLFYGKGSEFGMCGNLSCVSRRQ